MTLDINVGASGSLETKLRRAHWNLGDMVVLSRTTSIAGLGAPANGDIYIAPDAEITNPTQLVFRSEGTWLYLEPAAGWKVFVLDDGEFVVFDGAEWQPLATLLGADPLHRMSIYIPGTPTNSNGYVVYIRLSGGVIYADDFPLCTANALVASTGSAAFNVKKNGSTVATVTFAASAAGTYASTGAQSWADGDYFGIEAPASPDATLAGVTFTFTGTKA